MKFWIKPRVARTADGQNGEERWVIYSYFKNPSKDPPSPVYLHRTGVWDDSPYMGDNPVGIFNTKDDAEALLQSTEDCLLEAA
jgi:hypothetical protein